MRIKHLADLRSGQSITSEAIDPEGEYPVFGGNGLRGYTSSFTHDGQFILIGRQGALCGNINYAEGQFWASEHAVVVRPIQKYERLWFGELLRHLNLNQYSISAAQPGLAVERIRNLEVPVPPLHEQASISRYLRHATRNVAALIHNKRRLIALLNEEKQAIIQQAVSRGLDPHVPMKPSGVEWLGEIPAHWQLVRFKSRVGFQEGPGIMASDFRDSGVPLLRISCLAGNDATLDGCNFLDPEMVDKRWKHFGVQRSDYLLSASGNTGSVTKANELIAGAIPYTGILRLWAKSNTVDMEFVRYFLSSPLFQNQVSMAKSGVAIEHYGPTHLKRMWILLPPLLEQQESATRITSDLHHVDFVIGRIEREIDLIREYRTRLIADVVTGQLDVREAAASLPDIEETEVDSLLTASDSLEEGDDLAGEDLDHIESADAAD